MTKSETPPNYDLVILGGGINGSTLFRVSSDSGKKVLLLEKKDFASGTSQSSGMMVWGGILYLRNLEFKLVRKFCKARDSLIKNSKDVYTRRFHYAFLEKNERSFLTMRMGLALYRFLGLFKRGRTRRISNQQLPPEWEKKRFKNGLSYEEGFLKKSDCHFTLQWIFRTHKSVSQALNYCNVRSIEWEPDKKLFNVSFQTVDGTIQTVQSHNIVNACGVWADEVNKQFEVKTLRSHHLSKGVYLLLRNATQQQDAFVVDMEEHSDTICWVPWGQTIMWGPTESLVEDIKDLSVTQKDVQFLLDKLNSKVQTPFTNKDILNVRTGIRPLVKENNQPVQYGLDLSRKAILETNPEFPWHTIFGGKISGVLEFSNGVYKQIFKTRPQAVSLHSDIQIPSTTQYFQGMNLPDVRWSVEKTHAKCLEDYLRRRTNVAQWIPMGGLGFNQEFKSDIEAISRLIHSCPQEAERDFNNYIKQQIQERWNWEN